MNRGAIAVLCTAAVLTASPAHAYIDPGTGGLLVQLLTGGVAGLLVLAKLYWKRIRSVLGFAESPPDSSTRVSRHSSRSDEPE